MARLLWGNVFYKDKFAGILREETGGRCVYEYDLAYLEGENPAIAYTLPVTQVVHVNFSGLHPFFDNLVSEGWLEQAQARLLGKRSISRFELLLAFGYDCAGAVSVMDPDPTVFSDLLLDHNDAREMVVLNSRASLSGIQPKLAVTLKDNVYVPTKNQELSTHIAKFSSAIHSDLVENEYMTMRSFQTLLPNDTVAKVSLGHVKGVPGSALLIPRFDRKDGHRIHFEEFNQLLGRPSSAKYHGWYKDMSAFIRSTPVCLPAENYKLFERILAGLLLGNTDMHFKNFAMLHEATGLRLAPSYDQVSAVLYQFKTIALGLAGAMDRLIGSVTARHIMALGEEFGLQRSLVRAAVDRLKSRKNAAQEAIFESYGVSDPLKNKLIEFMETRWNGTFALIGQNLSKKP